VHDEHAVGTVDSYDLKLADWSSRPIQVYVVAPVNWLTPTTGSVCSMT
jgi:hypothetical protein